MHELPAASTPPAHVLDTTGKLLTLGPVREIAPIWSTALPELLSVTVLMLLVVPIVWLPNASVLGVTDTAAAGPTPVPESVTILVGRLEALLMMRRTAERAPPAVGVNVMKFTHESPAIMRAPEQLVLTEKSPGFAPANSRPEMISGADPMLLMTLVNVVLTPLLCVPKSNVDGETLIRGTARAPRPLSGTVCGLAGSLVSMLRTPRLVNSDSGLKATEMAQLNPGSNLVPVQLLPARMKSSALSPPTAIPVT